MGVEREGEDREDSGKISEMGTRDKWEYAGMHGERKVVVREIKN